jgi:hypothetical protein
MTPTFAMVKDMTAPDPAYRPTTLLLETLCAVSGWVRRCEKSVEEPVKHGGRLAAVDDLDPAETVDLVSGES